MGIPHYLSDFHVQLDPVNFLGFKDRHKMKWSHTLHTRALSYESAALLRKENKK